MRDAAKQNCISLLGLIQYKIGNVTGKMDDFSYTIRNYRPVDFHEFVLFRTETEKLKPAGRCASPQAITEQLCRPNYSPEQNLFIARIDGNIVAFMDLSPELDIGRVVLDCWVHPEHRRRGLATKMFVLARGRGRELGAKTAQVHVPENDRVAKDVISQLGLELTRRHLEMRLYMAEIRVQDTDRAAFGCRPLRQGEEDHLAWIQNRSFADQWGYNRNTTEEITYQMNIRKCSPGDVLLACEGERVTGFCWTGIVCGGREAVDERKGRIYMLGVDPDYIGKGVGRRVMLAGLAHLKGKDVAAVELTVDSENEEAGRLYLSLGFKVRTTSLWYEKSLTEV